MTKKPNLKKEARNIKADAMTMAMEVPDGVCGRAGCGGIPVVRIGSLLYCADCLKAMRLLYPKSFAAYWESKVAPLNVR